MGLTGVGIRIRVLKESPVKSVDIPAPQVATEEPKQPVPANA